MRLPHFLTPPALTPPSPCAVRSFFISTHRPFDVTGSTKAGEAYRMVVRKTQGGRRPWELFSSRSSIDPSKESTRFSLYVVDDEQVRRKKKNWG